MASPACKAWGLKVSSGTGKQAEAAVFHVTRHNHSHQQQSLQLNKANQTWSVLIRKTTTALGVGGWGGGGGVRGNQAGHDYCNKHSQHNKDCIWSKKQNEILSNFARYRNSGCPPFFLPHCFWRGKKKQNKQNLLWKQRVICKNIREVPNVMRRKWRADLSWDYLLLQTG